MNTISRGYRYAAVDAKNTIIGMRRLLLVVTIVLATLTVVPSFAAARPTRVSITFDDGAASQYQARSALAARGLNATFYVNSGLVGSSPYYMSWSQIHHLADDGNEIGGHTSTHPDLTTLTASQQTDEICGDRNALVSRGYAPTSFAYPFARWNATARDSARDCGYGSARGVGNVGCPNCAISESLPPTNPYVLRTVAGTVDTTTLTDMQNNVTRAVQNGGGWVIFVFHTLCDACADDNSTTPAKFAGFLDWLVAQQSAGVSVLTVQEAMALPAPPQPANLLQNPGLETLSASTGPSCWLRASYTGASGAGSTFGWADSASAHGGANAEQITISAYGDGDEKLLSAQDANAAQPVIGSITPLAGGTLVGTQYYKVTATTANGETTPSAEASAVADGTIKLAWAGAKGATGYRIYRGSASGQETLLATIGNVTSYSDAGGIAPGSEVPPSRNTAVRGTPCSPPAVAGHSYEVSAWYATSASANVRMVAYYRDTNGNWIFWREQALPATATWTQARWQTPAAPAGAIALSIGFSLRSAGTAIVDDLLLGDLIS